MATKSVKVICVENRTFSRDDFQKQVQDLRVPVVIRGLNLGNCCDRWTPAYLASKVQKKLVKIHVAPQSKMDFISKNFLYRTLPFDEFVARAAEDKHSEFFVNDQEWYYLRAVGDNARDDIAHFGRDFPEIAEDLVVPDFFEPDRFFSSVFRIASKGCRLWTHYDIMDNILIQVSGRKKVVLFHPNEALNLYLVGDKSAVVDIENYDVKMFPRFASVTRWECWLDPGDVLFIPALWFHNVVTEDFGVAVNVFWRHLEETHYNKKDTYGNKDLIVGERALQGVDRALKILETLPDDYRDFYARRMVINIEKKAFVETDNNEITSEGNHDSSKCGTLQK